MTCSAVSALGLMLIPSSDDREVWRVLLDPEAPGDDAKMSTDAGEAAATEETPEEEALPGLGAGGSDATTVPINNSAMAAWVSLSVG